MGLFRRGGIEERAITAADVIDLVNDRRRYGNVPVFIARRVGTLFEPPGADAGTTREWRRRLGGDLDTIALKALE